MGSKKSKALLPQVVEVAHEEVSEKIHFQHWFHTKVKTGELRAHQNKEIQVHFAELGLLEMEAEDTYNETLKSF